MHGIVRSLACACATIIAAAVPAPASADAPRDSATVALASPIGFTAADNTVIRVYFARNPVIWTGVPPELARNFGRGKQLPTGIAAEALPPALAARLPVRHGFQIMRVGPDVAMVSRSTRIVVDLIENVFR